ncbi:MAG: sugar phosphate isomerase/epimerase [Rhodobacteraceae bacterium]|nr:sugar phosphate isomerase/epimerase [Paracoccaceae bacterium]
MIPNGDLSIQMFSTRAAETLEEQLTLFAELGYTDVQPFFFGPPEDMAALDAFAARLRALGLTAKSGHFTFEVFDASPGLVEDIARRFGMSLVVIPWINPEDRPATAAGWQAIGDRLAAITDDMAARGLTFAYHNHDFEMRPLPDGRYPIELLLGDRVPFEPDLAWMVVGGADPLHWLGRYSGRIPAVHVKDLAPPGTAAEEKGFADVGHGIMDWQGLWDASVAAGAGLMVAEHDQPSDWRRFARNAVAAMRRFGA